MTDTEILQELERWFRGMKAINIPIDPGKGLEWIEELRKAKGEPELVTETGLPYDWENVRRVP